MSPPFCSETLRSIDDQGQDWRMHYYHDCKLHVSNNNVQLVCVGKVADVFLCHHRRHGHDHDMVLHAHHLCR